MDAYGDIAHMYICLGLHGGNVNSRPRDVANS